MYGWIEVWKRRTTENLRSEFRRLEDWKSRRVEEKRDFIFYRLPQPLKRVDDDTAEDWMIGRVEDWMIRRKLRS